MDNINSTYCNNITSKTGATSSGVMSTSCLDIMSKAELDVVSKYETELEKEAFLYTAKRNASLMFAKYL